MTNETPSIEGIEFLELVRDNGSTCLWKARQTSLDRLVTVRVLHGQAASDPALRSEFVGMSRILARMHNDGVIEVYDISDSAPSPYMVAEWADGPTVAEAVANAHGPLSLRASLVAASQVAGALDAAWNECRLLFRNLKPTEIRLAKEQAKIVNFGHAVCAPEGAGCYDSKGEIVGTPHFSAPEQLRGLPIDMRSEMFSLGATLYLMLTGHPPYEQMTPEQILANDRTGCVVNPRDLNPRVTVAAANLVSRLMMRDPKDRYASWNDFRSDVAAILSGKPPPRLAAIQAEGSMVAPPAKAPPPSEAGTAASRIESAARDLHGRNGSFFHALLWLLLAAWIVVLGNDRLGNPLGLPFTLFGEGSLLSALGGDNRGEDAGEDVEAVDEDLPADEVSSGGDVVAEDEVAPADDLERPRPQPSATAVESAPRQQKPALPDSAVEALARALLDGGRDAAVAALAGLGLDKSVESTLRDALSEIPDADVMVMDTLLERRGEVVTIIYYGKERDIRPIRGVNGALEAEFVGDGQGVRQVTFQIAKLSADERLRWMPNPGGEAEQSAYCLLAIQAGKRAAALSHAAECGPLAPIFKAAAEMAVAEEEE